MSRNFPLYMITTKLLSTKDKKQWLLIIFFAKASNLDDSNHPLPDEDINVQNQLNNINISEIDVMDQLNSLNINKAYGPDEIPPRLLTEAKNVISKPLSNLFNKSLQAHTFPKLWKQANVGAILKRCTLKHR